MYCDCSEKKSVELSINDWLDGIQKTVRASIKEAKDKKSEGRQHTMFM